MMEDGCEGYKDYYGDFDCGYGAGWLDCSDCMFGAWGGTLNPRKGEDEQEDTP